MNERKKAAIDKYHREKMESISFRATTADQLKERIKAGAEKHGIPPARYIRQAIEARLMLDGIPEPEDNTDE